MSRKKPTKIVNDTNSVAVTGDYNDNVREKEMLDKAIADSCPYKYFVLSHDCILGLQLSVCDAMKQGFKPTGGVSSYFDNPLGRRVWMQAVFKE